jgi:ubiquinone/menaquinone biosynthesis C-methylase UbiE
VGLDISPEMIRIARRKHPDTRFEVTSIEEFIPEVSFDYIFLADVIEHLQDLPRTMEVISRICAPNTRVIFTYANPLWEPILLLLESLSLKMPEGPHYRIPYFKFKRIIERTGFVTIERGWRLLVPAHIGFFSKAVNRYFYRLPLFKRLGMLEYAILGKSGIEL